MHRETSFVVTRRDRDGTVPVALCPTGDDALAEARRRSGADAIAEAVAVAVAELAPRPDVLDVRYEASFPPPRWSRVKPLADGTEEWLEGYRAFLRARVRVERRFLATRAEAEGRVLRAAGHDAASFAALDGVTGSPTYDVVEVGGVAAFRALETMGDAERFLA